MNRLDGEKGEKVFWCKHPGVVGKGKKIVAQTPEEAAELFWAPGFNINGVMVNRVLYTIEVIPKATKSKKV